MAVTYIHTHTRARHAQVMSLRFSRRRYAHATGGVDAPANDPHSTNAPPRTYLSNTADAAVYVYPRCWGGESSEACLPDSAINCFPWCMGLHIAGRKNQRIELKNQVQWERYENVAQQDCTIIPEETNCAGVGVARATSGVTASGKQVAEK